MARLRLASIGEAIINLRNGILFKLLSQGTKSLLIILTARKCPIYQLNFSKKYQVGPEKTDRNPKWFLHYRYFFLILYFVLELFNGHVVHYTMAVIHPLYQVHVGNVILHNLYFIAWGYHQ